MNRSIRHTFSTAELLADAASLFIAQRLERALNDDGRASLALSGGSSPKPTYERLAQADLDWSGVGVTLVDERWVPPGHPKSNADLVKDCFMDTPAGQSLFVPHYNGHESASAGVDALDQALRLIKHPLDVCIMGMGMDGHTASWFPNSPDLDALLSDSAGKIVGAAHAPDSDASSGINMRMTLTAQSVLSAGAIVLLLPSAEKTAVFDTKSQQLPSEAPVAKLLEAEDRLHIFAVEP